MIPDRVGKITTHELLTFAADNREKPQENRPEINFKHGLNRLVKSNGRKKFEVGVKKKR